MAPRANLIYAVRAQPRSDGPSNGKTMSDDTPGGIDDMLSDIDMTAEFDWGADELDEAAVAEVEVLRFAVGNTPFAARGSVVREVVGDVDVTRLPGAPPHIKGIAVLKRQVVGVIDLRQWLGLPRRRARRDDTSRMLVLEVGGLVAACAVDEVTGIETWPDLADGSNLPDTLDDRTRRFARSAQWAPGGIVVLLDFERILEEAAVR
jgi:purine-binding chemotaxis protein CheW